MNLQIAWENDNTKQADLCSTLGLDEAKQGVAISNTPLRIKPLYKQTKRVDTNTDTNRNGNETKVTD